MSQTEERFSESRHGKNISEHEGYKTKRAAVQFFMANAPAGQLCEVMENCELLVDPKAISHRFMEDTLEQAAEDQRQIVTFSIPGQGPSQAILCSAARLDKSLYIDPQTKHVLSVTSDGSYLSLSASPMDPEIFPAVLEPYRDAFANALANYVKERFACDSMSAGLRVPTDTSQVASVFSHPRKDTSPAPQLTAVLAAEADNKSNYWSCSWSSEWRVFFSPSDCSTDVRIEGFVNARSYLHEDGSMQANFSRHFGSSPSETFSGKPDENLQPSNPTVSSLPSAADVCSVSGSFVASPLKFAEELVGAIRTNEEKVVQEIDEFFLRKARQLAKGIRRVLPLFGKAFDWKQQSVQLQPQRFSRN